MITFADRDRLVDRLASEADRVMPARKTREFIAFLDRINRRQGRLV